MLQWLSHICIVTEELWHCTEDAEGHTHTWSRGKLLMGSHCLKIIVPTLHEQNTMCWDVLVCMNVFSHYMPSEYSILYSYSFNTARLVFAKKTSQSQYIHLSNFSICSRVPKLPRYTSVHSSRADWNYNVLQVNVVLLGPRSDFY